MVQYYTFMPMYGGGFVGKKEIYRLCMYTRRRRGGGGQGNNESVWGVHIYIKYTTLI